MEKARKMFYPSYQAVNPDESSDDLVNSTPPVWKSSAIICACLVIATLAFVAGIFVGRLSLVNNVDGLPLPCGSVKQTWQENQTFSEKPTAESEAAWQSLIPEGRGFVTHPILAPINKGLTVFHQLHCLHTLRVAHYKSLHDLRQLQNSSYSDPFLENIQAEADSEHIQHCFDYLRQALMCAADTNLESVNPVTKVTDGWGSERQCRDYWQVVHWAERWKNNAEHTILSAEVDAIHD